MAHLHHQKKMTDVLAAPRYPMSRCFWLGDSENVSAESVPGGWTV